MAKFYGAVGYVETVEKSPGKWVEEVVERHYFGEQIRNSRRLQNSGQVNDNVDITAEISIVTDPYADQHFHAIRYAEFMGAKWKVTNVTPQPPRLILTLGGVYHGSEQA